MKTETLRIIEEDIEQFKDACEEISGIELISYTNNEARIEYKYDHSLFYLGQVYQLKNKIKWI